ncbi:hypothetical protein QFZ70_000272 [Arthrobacter sp. V1I9]|nr:hypothetical protein [Arthrobacter sp. V1I9]
MSQSAAKVWAGMRSGVPSVSAVAEVVCHSPIAIRATEATMSSTQIAVRGQLRGYLDSDIVP